MPTSRHLMFGRLARYYDLLYAGKDYRSEVRRLEALVQRHGRSGGTSWLDVGCGTGRHLELLRRKHSVVGVDRSPEMLAIARRRLRGVPLHLGDMRTFELGHRYDVVSCLFSAIGHLRSRKELDRAFANFARHLKPGGVALVEPWIDPSSFRPGHVHIVTYRAPGLIVARVSHAARRDDRSAIRYDYLVAAERHPTQHFHEIDLGLLVSRRDLLRAMRRAGLGARFVTQGFSTGRGLLVGRKPLRTADGGRRGVKVGPHR